jgi:hypothetical protein
MAYLSLVLRQNDDSGVSRSDAKAEQSFTDGAFAGPAFSFARIPLRGDEISF